MRLNRLDLNLLIALDALLATRSVTAAAHQLHVTQPSMSGSLARLREYFGDPLLVQEGRSLKMTPLAEMLAGAVRETLDKVEETVSLRPSFDAVQSRRHFRLSASESTVITLLTRALQHVEQRAPGVTVEILPSNALLAVERLQKRDLDVIFVSERQVTPEHPKELVIEDLFACVVWKGNGDVGADLSLEQYLAMTHVVTRYGFDRYPGFEQYSLEQLGVQRRETITCATPALMGPLVMGTRRVATMPAQLARWQARLLPLKILPPPLPLPPLRVFMQWHRSRDHDGAMIWFRDTVLAASGLAKGG